MSRPLRGGLPRMFRSHFRALDERLGPFDAVSRQYAASVAALWCEWRGDTLALDASDNEAAVKHDSLVFVFNFFEELKRRVPTHELATSSRKHPSAEHVDDGLG